MPVLVRQSVSSHGRLDLPPSQTYSQVAPYARVGERTILAIYSKKKRRLAEQNRRLPVSSRTERQEAEPNPSQFLMSTFGGKADITQTSDNVCF